MIHSKHSIVIWAVDPDDETVKPSFSTLKFLESKSVYPVSITSPDQEITQNKLYSYLVSLGICNFHQPKVLISDSYDRDDYIKKILIFALENKASAIALSSHGRKGIDRLVMGSFAEKLLNISPIPILFLTESIFDLSKKAIFATDFSKNSEVAFKNFINFCEGSIDEIIIFHAGRSLVEALGVYSAIGVPAMFPNNFLRKNDEDEKELSVWAKKYKDINSQIKISTMVIDSPNTVSKSILEACKKRKVELVGVSSTLRPWESTVFGSVSKDIFRSGIVPVWVWGEFAYEVKQIRDSEASI